MYIPQTWIIQVGAERPQYSKHTSFTNGITLHPSGENNDFHLSVQFFALREGRIFLSTCPLKLCEFVGEPMD